MKSLSPRSLASASSDGIGGGSTLPSVLARELSESGLYLQTEDEMVPTPKAAGASIFASTAANNLIASERASHSSFLHRSPSAVVFSKDSVSLGSRSAHFKDGKDFNHDDFQLPKEVLYDGLEFQRYEDEIQAAYDGKMRKHNNRFSSKPLLHLDKFARVTTANLAASDLKQKGYADREDKLKARRTQMEAAVEIKTIKNVMGVRYNPADEKSLDRETMTQVSTLENPQLGSLEESLEDLREEGIERWCLRHHGRQAAVKFLNKDKRMLRKWFMELDDDGSGEVSIAELLDPMLSSGILKTKAQVMRVLANVDKNGTMGIDFEEFLVALEGGQLADNEKLKKLQAMSANPLGFSMESLLTEERRKKLFRSIVFQSSRRQNQYDKALERFERQKVGLSSLRDRERATLGFEKLEERQRKSTMFHNTYVAALKEVVDEKLGNVRDNDLNALTSFNGSQLSLTSSLHSGDRFRDEYSLEESKNRGRDDSDSDDDGLPPVGMRFCSDMYNKNPYFLFSPSKK